MEDDYQSADSLSAYTISEARRCRNVYRFLPKQFVAEGPSNIWTESRDTSLPPSGLTPRPSTDAALTAFAQLVTFRLNIDCCMISLIDHQYQYILAESKRNLPIRIAQKDSYPEGLWLGSLTLPRNRTIDQKVIDINVSTSKPSDDCTTVVIEDLSQFLSENTPALAKDYSRWGFYAGTPLYSSSRAIVGVLSVLDTHPRSKALSAEDQTTLQDMAITVMDLLTARKAHEERSRGEKMVQGLADFLHGAPSISEPPIRRTSSPMVDPLQSTKSTSTPTIPSLASSPSTSPPPPIREFKDLELRASISSGNLDHDEFEPYDSITDLDSEHATSTSVTGPHGESMYEAQEITISRNNNRPRESTTAEMQKSILPRNAETMFFRAANVMRQTCELDGVVFLDASVAAMSREDGRKLSLRDSLYQNDDDPHGTHMRSNRQNSSASSKESLSSSDSSRLDRPDAKSEVRQCQILGSSQTHTPSTNNGKTQSSQVSLPEKVLRRILRSYPHGKIFNYGTEGSIVTSSSDEHTIVSRIATKASKSKNSSRRRQKSRSISSLLKTIIPDAQSICLLPLWDYDRSRWFTCCIAWTATPMRILSPSADLMFFKAFSNSVMSELSRLDLASSDKMKTTFISSISHELRSPLHGILVSIDFLQNTNMDAFQQSMLLSANTCGRTLLDVINHVLDLAQMQQIQGVKKSRLQICDNHTLYMPPRRKTSTNFDVKKLLPISNLRVVTEEVVESVFTSFSYRIKQGDMKDDDMQSYEEFQGSGAVPNKSLIMDKRKLVLVILDIPLQAERPVDIPVGAWRRILMNLIGNAIKYTESGYIKISMKLSDTDQKLDSKHPRLTINVSDTGIGMSPDFLMNRLFTPFSQENSFSAGIGLGLHLVQHLVDSLGGSIKFRSISGEGTDIKIVLDAPRSVASVADASSAGGESRLSSVRRRLSGKTICVLHSTTADSRFTSEEQSTGARLFREAIFRTLEVWLGITPTFTDKWTGQDVDFVIMLEPSFDSLASIRNMTSANRPPPLTLMLAIDAVEADALIHDARILSKESVVEVIAQPFGPEKLARVLDHCLDRYEANESVDVTETVRPGASTRSQSLFTSFSELSPLQSPELPEPDSAVLITDDNSINRRLLVALMQKHNIRYFEASNGLEALETYKTHHQEIAAIFMDISMPIMDGMTSTREIRRFERSSKLSPTTIIALTGLVSPSTRLEAAESGVNEFLTKPVNFAKLTGLLPDIFKKV